MGEIDSDAESEDQPEQGTSARQHEALRQQLSNKPYAARTERTAHGEFLAARSGAR